MRVRVAAEELVVRAPKTLRQAAERYFDLRLKLGYQLRTEREEVKLFVQEMEALRRRKITLDHVVEWARGSPGRSVRYAAGRYEAVRRFLAVAACWLKEVVRPPPGYLGRSYGRRTPHVYSNEEVAQLLVASRTLTPTTGLRPRTYETLFGLLAATGMRVGETLSLDRGDVDMERCEVTVRHGKSGGRTLPIHASVAEQLSRYAASRDARHPRPRSPAFFLTETRGTRLKYLYVNRAFCRLRREMGWTVRPLPTVHDLRHTFAVRTFLSWFRAGRDVDEELPALTAYLGHKTPAATYWYLSTVPELQHIITGYLKPLPGFLPGLKGT